MGHGWGQTITRSIKVDIQTEEYREYHKRLLILGVTGDGDLAAKGVVWV